MFEHFEKINKTANSSTATRAVVFLATDHKSHLEKKIALAVKVQTNSDPEIRAHRAIDYIVAILKANKLSRINVCRLRQSLIKDFEQWRKQISNGKYQALSNYLYFGLVQRGDVFPSILL